MSRVVLARPQLVTFNGNKLSDHNRDALTTATEQIEVKQRMADGTMRKYFVAVKRTWSTAYTNLPGTDVRTVDGRWGANSIISFYLANAGTPFTLGIAYESVTETHTVMFSAFESDLAKRGIDDLYNLSFSVEEV